MSFTSPPGPPHQPPGAYPPPYLPPQQPFNVPVAYPPAVERQPSALAVALQRAVARRGKDAAASIRTVLAIALAAFLTDLFLHDGFGGVGVLFTTTLVAALLVSVGAVRRAAGVGLLVLAIALGVIWTLRVSPWVRVPVGISLCGCLAGASFFGRRGDLFDLAWKRPLAMPGELAIHGWLAPRWVSRGMGTRARAPRALTASVVGRALLIVVPLLTVLTVLLVTADPLFANVLRAPFDLRSWPTQLGTFLLGGAVVALLARVGFHEPDHATGLRTGPRLGATETLIVEVAVALLLGIFMATQVAAALGFGHRLLAERGITYASYARTGYFQLLWVVGIVVVLLVVLDATGEGHRAATRIAALVVVALTLGVEYTAIRRLLLYNGAYGLTMLRLSCLFGAAFMCMLLVLVGAWVASTHRSRNWLPATVGVALIATVVVLGAINPEHVVVNYDVAHRQTIHLDVRYLSSLSDDAVPSLVSALPVLPHPVATSLRASVCGRTASASGWAQWTASEDDADHAEDRACP